MIETFETLENLSQAGGFEPPNFCSKQHNIESTKEGNREVETLKIACYQDEIDNRYGIEGLNSQREERMFIELGRYMYKNRVHLPIKIEKEKTPFGTKKTVSLSLVDLKKYKELKSTAKEQDQLISALVSLNKVKDFMLEKQAEDFKGVLNTIEEVLEILHKTL